MVFSSVLFLFYFFPAVLILYFLVPKRYTKIRNFVLFVTSLVFYAWGEPVYIILMLITITIGYGGGLLLDKYLKMGDRSKAKLIVILTIIVDLGILGFFKYGDFLVSNLNGLFGLQIPAINLPLPIGISFYTFQTLSYTIDLYRGETKVQRNYVSFGTYVALFPQLIAGPIVRFQTVAEELNERTESVDEFGAGIQRFVLGLGKKVLLANNIGMVWDSISSMGVHDLPVVTAWIGILAYTFQIYFDFSGYSDMAIGLGRMFGFHFLENFDYPYMSKSITEFWRRWHISLSTWFKEYVYIPLGGNRRGKGLQIRNIVIVWLLTGLWHGASWNFVAWGAFFGLFLILEKLFLLRWLEKLPNLVGHIYTMFLVIISWALFAFSSFGQAFDYIKAMFGGYGNVFANGESVYLLYTNLILFIVLIIGCTNLPKRFVQKIKNRGTVGTVKFAASQVVLLGMLVLSIAFMVDASYNPFLYFRF